MHRHNIYPGMVYDQLGLEDATIYISGFFAMGGFGLALFTYYVFAEMDAAPQIEEEISKTRGWSMVKNFREQLKILQVLF